MVCGTSAHTPGCALASFLQKDRIAYSTLTGVPSLRLFSDCCPFQRSLPDVGSLKRRVHTQISHSNMQGVEKLLELGGSIDFRDAAERTILHRACEDVSTL